jgi:hypothetical protein
LTENELKVNHFSCNYTSNLARKLNFPSFFKRNKIEKLREIKWRSMFKEWQKHYVPYKFKISDKLVSRVYKGIPDSMRNLAWLKLLDVESQMKEQSGVYEVNLF